MTLQPHQQRVVDERNELLDRIEKLEQFIQSSPIYASLPHDEKFRLTAQLHVMKAYFWILGERIANFPEMRDSVAQYDAFFSAIQPRVEEQ